MPRDGQGNPVSSFGRGRLNDEIASHGSKAVAPKSRPAGHQPDPDAEMREENPEDIKDIVAEHGPAVEMHHQHDGEMHHVTTHHGEHRQGKEDGMGFTHHSKHASHHEAHEHMGHALGIESKAHEKGESKEFEAGEHEGAREMSIPGLKS